jgi:hypothetical protein
MRSKILAACVGTTSVILLLCGGPARAQTGSADYSFVVASGFLCDAGGSGTCLAVAKSTNGDSYEISGAGTFDQKNKSVKAAGTFNHKSMNGNVVETGVWIASDLLSFDSYGVAPTALIQKGGVFGRPQIGAAKRPLPSELVPTGGLAKFRIQLMPLSGATKTALLQVNCALGDVPRDRSVEGIRVTLERNNFEYSGETSGRVMFLALRREVSASAKTPELEAGPEAPEQPQK